ncbi:hypothetical protein [Edaphobacter sp.]|uniref:hypothetical protein n=1 Tax=Edaphobacter sp. TaxID=1934404 RepID=UPI002DBAC867|nr:hypothetical protein [Edaphobacter sp.]HEU5340517.1 hypothetical protein [Edaphobacter sp.]
MSFISVMETIGKDFAKGLKWAAAYALPAEKLVALLFPSAAPVINELADATTLIQNAVLVVEQKFAAEGRQSGTGAQKLGEVLALVEQTVTALLAKAGIHADTSYIEKIVSAVVALLNVQQTPTAATGAAA